MEELSLPAWERGLKLSGIALVKCDIASLPAWERGLKPVEGGFKVIKYGRSLRGSVD